MKVFLFITLSLRAPWAEGKFVKRSLASHPLAKCNDGTPANYYYSDDLLHATKLVINLQGGGACYDKQGCKNRLEHNVNRKYTTIQIPNTCMFRCKNGNILCTESPDEEKDLWKTMWSNDPEENPPFHDAAKVWRKFQNTSKN